MHNWDYPKNQNLKKNEIWHMERVLCFGLAGEKIDRKALVRHFDRLKIPENTKTFLKLLLWDKPF